MKVYTTDKIRNVVLLGHGGSGKTALTEALAYLSGITSRMGKLPHFYTIILYYFYGGLSTIYWVNDE